MHTCLLCCLYYLTIRLRDEFSTSKLSTSVAGTEARVRSSIVLPSNWNKFSDWKKTGHVSWVWTNLLPRVNKTHKLPRETTTWTFDLHVIRSCSLKLRQNCEPASVKKNEFFAAFSTSELVGITKRLMTDLNTVGFGEIKITVSLGASH